MGITSAPDIGGKHHVPKEWPIRSFWRQCGHGFRARNEPRWCERCAVLLDHHECRFQAVDQEQDIGKDVYVDIADNAGITPFCVALQIKSGVSYRTADRYAVPVDYHADLWRRSAVPVFGIVYDPEDEQIRWLDMTGYLRAHPEQSGGSVPVVARQTLDVMTLRCAHTLLAAPPILS